MIHIFTFCLVCLLLCSCSNEKGNILDAPTLSAIDLNHTRAAKTFVKKQIAAEAYYYRSLASFVNGSATQNILEDYPSPVEEVNLVVLYEAGAPWAKLLDTGSLKTTGNKQLNTLLGAYQLEIVKQFTIDQNNKGLVLEATGALNDPVETARRLSLIEHVLMVNIKEIPAYY